MNTADCDDQRSSGQSKQNIGNTDDDQRSPGQSKLNTGHTDDDQQSLGQSRQTTGQQTLLGKKRTRNELAGSDDQPTPEQSNKVTGVKVPKPAKHEPAYSDPDAGAGSSTRRVGRIWLYIQ